MSLQRLLPELGLQPKASHLKICSADGFWEIVSLEAIRADERVMLAYERAAQQNANVLGSPLKGMEWHYCPLIEPKIQHHGYFYRNGRAGPIALVK